MGKLTQKKEKLNEGASTDSSSSPVKSHSSRASSASQLSVDDDLGLPTCRVCQCVESDKAGDSALGFLGIYTLLKDEPNASEQLGHEINTPSENTEGSASTNTNQKLEPGYVKFVSPNGEVFIFSTDLEMGACRNRDALIELGCSCKNDLALVHYACALKWFVSHGSTRLILRRCMMIPVWIPMQLPAIRRLRLSEIYLTSHLRGVLASLKDYEALRDMTASEAANPAQVHDDSGVDPDAIASYSEAETKDFIGDWPAYCYSRVAHRASCWGGKFNSETSTLLMLVVEQPSNLVIEAVTPPEHPATKWAVEGAGILLATGLLTVILAWLIAPRVGAKTAKNGLHILLGGVCALAVVRFFCRFCTNFVLTRIKYGPARCWAILFVFWFLVFGIWASRTHSTHPT
ncbi:hypothetical protein RND81_10G098800 [Saponaria officinalis]|uniref:RING-CH-type domain-containing protein n=1 Tax=Saponaria officinalis TaxID=3572 RepID=A0AAW1HZQ0_SAPOF